MGWAAHLAAADKAVRSQLGAAVTYTPAAGAPAVVTGIFDATYVRAEAGIAGVSSSGPAVFLTLADLPSDPAQEDGTGVTVAGVLYVVTEVHKDGQGGCRLLLQRA